MLLELWTGYLFLALFFIYFLFVIITQYAEFNTWTPCTLCLVVCCLRKYLSMKKSEFVNVNYASQSSAIQVYSSQFKQCLLCILFTVVCVCVSVLHQCRGYLLVNLIKHANISCHLGTKLKQLCVSCFVFKEAEWQLTEIDMVVLADNKQNEQSQALTLGVLVGGKQCHCEMKWEDTNRHNAFYSDIVPFYPFLWYKKFPPTSPPKIKDKQNLHCWKPLFKLQTLQNLT